MRAQKNGASMVSSKEHEEVVTAARDGPSKPGQKIKASGPRSVVRLTPEQLTRKRAADRASQRAMRQRHQDRIKFLEEKIEDLTGNAGDDWTFQVAQRRTLELEDEIRRMRAFLLRARHGMGNPITLIDRTRSPASNQMQPVKSKPPNADPYYAMPRSILGSPLLKQPQVHIWECPLALGSPKNPIEHILYGMVETQRAHNGPGITGTDLAGPRIPSMSALVAPERGRPVHIVTRIISELLGKITYRTFVDKLGAFMVMYPLYQWLIMQSAETYNNIPSWLQPILSQRSTPHPVWILGLGSPSMREFVIANQEDYATEEFQYKFVESLNINWPYGLDAALMWTKDGDVKVSKRFWDHTRDFANFTLDEPFQRRYPELRNVYPFTPYPEDGTRGVVGV